MFLTMIRQSKMATMKRCVWSSMFRLNFKFSANMINKYLLFICVTSKLFTQISGSNYGFVTCGSVIKLLNPNFNVRLHSHDVKYGSGSGQQSVTATDEQDDINSHWIVKGPLPGFSDCPRGEPIKCGTKVRFEHLKTSRNLHSHHFPSPLSTNQEVSAFGDHGEGDTGDVWIVTCSDELWKRDEQIRFKHVDTDGWLSVTGHSYGRPINGQMEVAAVNYPDSNCYWKTAEGVFIKPSDYVKPPTHEHNEL